MSVPDDRLVETAAKFDRLQATRRMDLERAVADARATTSAQVRDEFRRSTAPTIVDPVFNAAASGRLSADHAAVVLASLDRTRFLTEDGDVDRARIEAYIAGLAGDRGPGGQRGDSDARRHGRHVRRTGPSSVANGRELYRSRRTRE